MKNKTSIKYIRNFAIIAHIDHGKSTLADRLMQSCGSISEREMKDQLLDSMDIERERGITIKAQTVRLYYTAEDQQTYQLNLMDTPGHVDFAYEVSRSLAACEGSILIVDASQGVEAQTLANVYQAIDHNHEIIPIINKIDLPAAEPEKIKQQIEDVIGIDASNAVAASAKTGQGVNEILEKIVQFIPAPKLEQEDYLSALLVDSWYDPYLGVMILVRIFAGSIKKGQKIKMLASKAVHNVDKIGCFSPKKEYLEELNCGEIGFITAGIKYVANCKVGDTITDYKNNQIKPLAGFKSSIPVVFCGFFPVDAADFDNLKDSLEKLSLNDASFVFEAESSAALGFGFRCGFLGLLHLEIIQERLDREYNVNIITTAPSVVYKIFMTDESLVELHNPADFPDIVKIKEIQEPWIKATILVPDSYLGGVLSLCTERRGIQRNLTYAGARAMLTYDLPLNEVVFDFYDCLKSISKGYASFDYEVSDYKVGDLVKIVILVNTEPVDSLSFISNRIQAETRGRNICAKLKELIPRKLFKIPIQAAIGGKIIARETIAAMRKDVTAKCYGGDVSRKRKLLSKQKAGKKKMRNFGNVEIPQSAFLAVLKQ